MHDLVQENFDLDKSKEYILSIQASLDGFSFSVYDPNSNSILSFHNSNVKISSVDLITRRFEEWLDSKDVLGNPFAKVTFYYHSKDFTTIPESFQASDYNNVYETLIFDSEKKSVLQKNKIAESNYWAYFTIPTSLKELVVDTFESVEFKHPIESIIFENKIEQPVLKLYFTSGYFHLVLNNSGKIELVNTFETSSPTSHRSA